MFPFTNRFKFGSYDEDENPLIAPYGNIDFTSPNNQTYGSLQQPPQPNFFDAYKQLMAQKEGPSMTAYRDFISKGYPQPESPNWGTRLGAILSGAAAGFTRPGSGYGVARDIIQDPYKQQVTHYNLEANRLGKSAELEEGQRQHNLTAVKSILDAEDKSRDNQRLEENTASQIGLRNIQAKKLVQELKTAGYKQLTNKITGHVEMHSISDPTDIIDLGKIDQSINEKALDDVAKEERGYNRSVNLENVRQGNREKSQKAGQVFSREQQGRTFTQQDKNREDIQSFQFGERQGRQAFEENLNRVRQEAINARAKLRTEKPQSFGEVSKRNKEATKALIAQNPDRYKGLYDDAADPDITNKYPDDIDSFNAFAELFNTLYKDIPGIAPLAPKKKYQVVR